MRVNTIIAGGVKAGIGARGNVRVQKVNERAMLHRMVLTWDEVATRAKSSATKRENNVAERAPEELRRGKESGRDGTARARGINMRSPVGRGTKPGVELGETGTKRKGEGAKNTQQWENMRPR